MISEIKKHFSMMLAASEASLFYSSNADLNSESYEFQELVTQILSISE